MPSDDQVWRLMRRAFGVPDVVSAEHQAAAVAWKMMALGPPSSAPSDDARDHSDTMTVAQRLVDQIVAGNLDEAFVRIQPHFPPRSHVISELVDVVVERLPRRGATAVACVEHLVAFVDQHPYQDDAGRDLDLPYDAPPDAHGEPSDDEDGLLD